MCASRLSAGPDFWQPISITTGYRSHLAPPLICSTTPRSRSSFAGARRNPYEFERQLRKSPLNSMHRCSLGQAPIAAKHRKIGVQTLQEIACVGPIKQLGEIRAGNSAHAGNNVRYNASAPIIGCSAPTRSVPPSPARPRAATVSTSISRMCAPQRTRNLSALEKRLPVERVSPHFAGIGPSSVRSVIEHEPDSFRPHRGHSRPVVRSRWLTERIYGGLQGNV